MYPVGVCDESGNITGKAVKTKRIPMSPPEKMADRGREDGPTFQSGGVTGE